MDLSGKSAAGVLLVVLALAAFLPTVRNGFVWDDDANVTNNSNMRSVGGLARTWADPWSNQQYYPLTHTSFWIQYQIFGATPWPYHLLNVLLHAATALVLLMILERLALPGAWLAAALFALHPLQVESVAWITERKNTLAGLFLAMAVLAYVRTDAPRFPMAALVLFACALGAKTAVATAPIAILAIVWWKQGRLGRSDALRIAPFIVLGVSAGLLTAWLERTHVGAAGGAWGAGPLERVLTAGRIAWFYVGKFVLPVGQAFFYPKWETGAGLPSAWILTLGAVAVPIALWAARGRIGRGPLAAAVAYLALLAPASGLFNVYFFRYAYVQDHFQYFACAALAAAAGAAVAMAIPALRLRTVAYAVIVVTLGTLSVRRAMVFASSETLWRDTIAKNPRSGVARVILGNLLIDQGRSAEGSQLLDAALAQDPANTDAILGQARVLGRAGNREAAVARVRDALAIDPALPVAHNSLGNMLLDLGRHAEALSEYDAALQLRPDYVDALMNRGIVLTRLGRVADGLTALERAVQLDPGGAVPRLNLGIALRGAGRAEAALTQLDRALSIDPALAPAQFQRGLALEQLGRPRDAIEAYRSALRARPGMTEARQRLEAVQGTTPETTGTNQTP